MKHLPSRWIGAFGPFLLLGVLLNMVGGGSASAAIYTVDRVDDTAGTGGACTTAPVDCSLRGAVQRANAAPAADVIEFDSTVFATPQIISLNSSLDYIVSNVTIIGPGADKLNLHTGSSQFDVFMVNAPVTVNLSNLRLTNARGAAGAAYGSTLNVKNCTFYSNGIGIIISDSNTTATVTNCLLSRNRHYGMVNVGGTLTATNCNFEGSDNYASLYNYYGGTATVTGCSMSGVPNGVGTNTGMINDDGTLTAVNCTVTGSTVGITNGSTTTVTNCTVSGNSNGLNNYRGETVLRNTIAAGNTHNLMGTFTFYGFNAITGTAAEAGLEVSSNGSPVLKANGGPTPTIALVTRGTAVNNGDNGQLPSGISTDQRGTGFPRIKGGRTDIGAFESDFSGAMVSVGGTVSAKEGSSGAPGAATFTVTLSTELTQPVTVNYATADGASNGAKAGSDYVGVSGLLTFQPGEISKTVRVPLIGDAVAEADEPFYLDIKTPDGATIGSDRATAVIKNDDGPSITIDNAATIDEGNSGTSLQVFTVRLSAASTTKVTVDWATANGTADATDFVAASGTLTFNPGVTSKIIVIQVKGDKQVEPTETYKVNLSNPTLAVITDSQGIGYIRNDDVAAPLIDSDEPSA